MKNLFEKKNYSLFAYKSVQDTFVYNSRHFDVIVVRWNGPSPYSEYDEQKQFWNVYIRFMPSFPNFDRLPGHCNDFDLISFAATYYKEDGKAKVFGNDYISSTTAIHNKDFDKTNHVYFDAHKIINSLNNIVNAGGVL